MLRGNVIKALERQIGLGDRKKKMSDDIERPVKRCLWKACKAGFVPSCLERKVKNRPGKRFSIRRLHRKIQEKGR